MTDDPRWGQRRFDDPDRQPEEPFIVIATKEQMEALEASAIEARLTHPRSGGDVTGGYGPSLPARLGLCPVHGQEFYMPLDDTDSLTCPECDERMVIYRRAS